jgi:hypothetical protein
MLLSAEHVTIAPFGRVIMSVIYRLPPSEEIPDDLRILRLSMRYGSISSRIKLFAESRWISLHILRRPEEVAPAKAGIPLFSSLRDSLKSLVTWLLSYVCFSTVDFSMLRIETNLESYIARNLSPFMRWRDIVLSMCWVCVFNYLCICWFLKSYTITNPFSGEQEIR